MCMSYLYLETTQTQETPLQRTEETSYVYRDFIFACMYTHRYESVVK